ncbi:MAG TPA: hypothetical protein VIG99_23370 [Myxococcaceae bacterium]|jgi:hypothetical protein
MRALLLTAATAAGLAGCATSRAPLMQMADARGEIRAAEQLNADHIPTASNYLALARQEEDQGRRLLNAGQETRASYVLARAKADAELALALATEAPVREEAQRAMDQVKQLQSQMPATQAPPPEVKP